MEGLLKRVRKQIWFWTKAFFLVLGCFMIARLILGLILGREFDLPPVDDALLARATALHEEAILLDGHNDIPTWIQRYGFDLAMDGAESGDRSPFLYYLADWLPWKPDGDNIRTHTDFARMEEGGLDAQFFSIWVDCRYLEDGVYGTSKQQALDMLGDFRKMLDRHPDRIGLALTANDVETLVSEGKFTALLGLEGGHAIENNLGNLRQFFDLGIRYMTLTHSCTNGWADSSSDFHDRDVAHHGGLSDFGFRVIEEMNRLGMIIDVSHIGDETYWDVMETSVAPVMASHSSVRSIAYVARNLTDDMMRVIASRGGIVMINFRAGYLDPRKTDDWKIFSGWYWFTHPGGTFTPLSLLIDHIDHAVRIAGIDHVGLGSDFDGVMMLPRHMDDVSDFPKITVELLRRDYSDDDVRKILGGNAFRVLKDVAQVAKDLKLQTD